MEGSCENCTFQDVKEEDVICGNCVEENGNYELFIEHCDENLHLGEKYRRHAELVKRLNAVYITKNQDYNDAFGKSFKEWGIIASVIRMSDKMERIKALAKNGNRVKDESMYDSLLDLANYCIKSYIELERSGELSERSM